ncbi:MAG: porin family protein [Gemmatimonadales bacterium]|nr:porin family protein [Gemmatimonadales bacterium]
MRRPIVRLALTAAALAAVAPAASAQNILIGPMAGANLSKLDVSNVGASVSSRTGFLGGAFTRIALGPSLAIGAEAFFSGQGADPVGAINRVDLHYVNVPVYLRVAVPLPVVKPFAFAGPQLGMKVKCEQRAAATNTVSDCPTGFKSADWSAVGGVGVEIGLGGGALVSTLRYQYGLSELGNVGALTDLKNRVATFTLGYGIKFGL